MKTRARMMLALGLLGGMGIPASVVAAPIVAAPIALDKPVGKSQTPQSLTRMADGYLAIWIDDRDLLGRRLYTMILDNAGRPSGTATLIDVRLELSSFRTAWNGRHFLVADAYQVLRLDASGKLVGELRLPATLHISSEGEAANLDVGLASDGDVFLVAWEDIRNSPSGPPTLYPKTVHDIYATRIADDGTRLDPDPFLVSADGMTQTTPAIAFDGSNYLVIWKEDTLTGIRGIRVDRSGALVDATSFPIAVTGAGERPAVVWGKDSYLVAWNVNDGTACRRVDATGKVLDATDIFIPTDPNWRILDITAAWNGQSFLVGGVGQVRGPGAAFAARVGADGSLPDGSGFEIEPHGAGETAAQSAYPTGLGLAGDSSGHWISLTDKYDPTVGVEAVRVRSRLITDCTGSQCPALPDGGVVSPDAGRDASSSEAGKDSVARDAATIVDGRAGGGGAGGGGSGGSGGSAPDAGTSALADARVADSARGNSPDVPQTSDGGRSVDVAQPGPDGAAKDASHATSIGDAPGVVAQGDGAAARDAATGMAQSKTSGCSCSLGGASRVGDSPWLVVGVGLALRRRRTKRASRR